MAYEPKQSAQELREADAMAMAELIYDIYQEKKQKERNDASS
jgi:RNA polymerase-interacting CarD/CdnL/TRCF family regulator